MKLLKPLNMFLEFKKTSGRYLGLNIAHKYVGLAVSDSRNKVASPLRVWDREKTNIDCMSEDFRILISEFSPVGFIVGYPFAPFPLRSNLDGVQVNAFVDDLCKTGNLEGLKYTYWENHLTIENAKQLVRHVNLPLDVSERIINKFAAAQVLQGYLDYINTEEVKSKEEGDGSE